MKSQHNTLLLIFKLVDIPGLYLYLMSSWIFLILVIRICLNPEDSLKDFDLDIFLIPFVIVFFMASILNFIDMSTAFWDKISKGAKWFILNCCYLLFIIISSITISLFKNGNGDCLAGSIVMVFLPSIFVIPLISFAIAALWKKKKWKMEN